MSIKAFPNQKKLTKQLSGITQAQSDTHAQFITAQPTSSDKIGLDSVQIGVYRTSALVKTATASTVEPKRIITNTAHGGLVGDMVRFQDTAANAGFESAILSIPDANTIVLASESPLDIVTGNEFFILRHVVPRYDATGSTIATLTPVPIQFVRNAVNTDVSQDTSTPSNSRPLPIRVLNPDGTEVTPATSGAQTTTNASLSSIDTKLTSQATAANQATTNGSLSSIDTKLTSQATAANQTAQATLTGAVVETAPATDTASSGLNGRLQRIAQRLTSLIGLLPAALGSTVAASSLGVALSTEDIARQGIITETAPASDTASSGINGRLQRIAQRLTSLIAQVPAALGQTTMANSLAVTLASNQSSIPVASTLTAETTKVIGTVNIAASQTVGLVAGATIIGSLTANQSVNVAQMNGVTVTMGNGASGTGVQRITIASDSTGSIKQGAKTAVTLTRNDYTSVSVTTAAYTQLIASTSAAISEIEIFDSSGQTLALATGAAASEVNQVFIFPGGNGRIPLSIAAGVRVSIRAISATASVGESTINYYSV